MKCLSIILLLSFSPYRSVANSFQESRDTTDEALGVAGVAGGTGLMAFGTTLVVGSQSEVQRGKALIAEGSGPPLLLEPDSNLSSKIQRRLEVGRHGD